MLQLNTSYQASASNKGSRKGQGVDMLVLHSTETDSIESAIKELTVGDRRVSAHYLIDRDGTIYCLVPEEEKANHAGESRWRVATGEEVRNINSRSIGIEFQCRSGQNFTPAQIEAGLKLTKQITQKYGIDPNDVVAHSDIAPERKSDPGDNFPWELFKQAGIAANGTRRGGGKINESYLATPEYAQMERLATNLRLNREETERRTEQTAALAQEAATQNAAAAAMPSTGNLLSGLAQTAMSFTSGNTKLALFGVALLADISGAMTQETPQKQTLADTESRGASSVLSDAGTLVSDTLSESPIGQAISAVKGMV